MESYVKPSMEIIPIEFEQAILGSGTGEDYPELGDPTEGYD